MEKVKKAYYLLFYKLSCFFKAISEDSLSEWKALVIIGGAQMLLIVELIVWWTVITKQGIKISKYWFAVPVGLLITVINYYVFLYNNRWKEYEEEFKNYPKGKSVMAGWIVFLFLLGVLGSLIFAFYQMSLIDWSQYR